MCLLKAIFWHLFLNGARTSFNETCELGVIDVVYGALLLHLRQAPKLLSKLLATGVANLRMRLWRLCDLKFDQSTIIMHHRRPCDQNTTRMRWWWLVWCVRWQEHPTATVLYVVGRNVVKELFFEDTYTPCLASDLFADIVTATCKGTFKRKRGSCFWQVLWAHV